MAWAIRSLALAAGAAALLSAQAAHAAVNTRLAVDPLVALSAFGTAQSRAAVCAAGSAAVAAGAAAAQAPGQNCPLLPVVTQPPAAAPPPVTTTDLPPPPPPSGGGFGINPLYILGGLLVGGLLLWLLLDDKDKDRDPVSPA